MKVCPRCKRAGSQVGKCANFKLSCPPPVDLPDETRITIKCGPCGKVRACTAADLLRGTPPFKETCRKKKENCAAIVIHPTAKEPKAPKEK